MAKQLNRVISEKKDFSNLVTIWKVSDFRELMVSILVASIIVGGLYSGSGKQKVRLLKKYRHVALTDKGCFQWLDLYMYNVKNVDATPTDYVFFERK